MRTIGFVTVALLVGLLGACSTPAEKASEAQMEASKAQEEIARERLDLVDKYKTCVEEAAGDQPKAQACDSYLKAAEALQ